jgi:lipoprotein-anchoring transpeptidase ErfK/SrfK
MFKMRRNSAKKVLYMSRLFKLITASVVLVILCSAGAYALTRPTKVPKQLSVANISKKAAVSKAKTTRATAATPAASTTPAPTPTPIPPPVATGPCASNTLSQLILVSIGQRHLWACNQTTVAYDSAVITGMENLPADLTPVGTYHIYGKQTNLTLSGSDSTGSWNDPVSYWMPFLNNQYGAYGFHDATWRPADAFGNVSPDSSDASHGCVELPLATASWIYNWSVIGTTVTIES